MSKQLPKAALSTMSDLHRESADAVSAQAAEAAAPAGASVAGGALRVDAGLRRAQAMLIVERHAMYAALGGCIPFALFDALGVGASTFNMVRSLATHYAVPFRHDQLKAAVAALVAGVAAPGLGGIVTQALGRIVPGAWIVSTATSSAAAAALTSYLGRAFVEHFEAGGNIFDFDAARLRAFRA